MTGQTPVRVGPLSGGTAAKRPIFIVSALLLASIIVGFDTRVFTVGLPDLRGAFGLSFDEASWFSTAANAPQIFIAPAVAWFVTVFGVRRVMIPSSAIYSIVSLFIPYIHNYDVLVVAHIVRALLLGVFVPATLMVVFRNLPPRYWIVGLGIYSLRIPLAQSLGFVLVGFYGDGIGWQWLYWQDVIVAPLIGLLLIVGAPREPINIPLLEHADWGGMLLLGASTSFIYVALDQGNRLNWFESGIVVSCLLVGCALLAGFFLNEGMVRRPWAHLNVLKSRNVCLGIGVIAVFTFTSSVSGSLVPGFLQTVVGLRPSAIAQLFLNYSVAPIFIVVALTTLALRYLDPRWVVVGGLSCCAISARLGWNITAVWFPGSFSTIVLLSTIGQLMTLFGVLTFMVSNLDPSRSTAMSAYIQVSRLGSAEIAASVVGTLIRVREQFHSNTLSAYLSSARGSFVRETQLLETLYGPSPASPAKTLLTVSSETRSQAYVLAYADIFVVAFWFAVAGMILVVLMQPSPRGPLSPSNLPRLSELQRRACKWFRGRKAPWHEVKVDRKPNCAGTYNLLSAIPDTVSPPAGSSSPRI